MKLEQNQPLTNANVLAMRGHAYPRVNRGRIIVQKWPAKRGRIKSPAQQAWVDRFSCLADTFKDFEPKQYDFAKKYTKGTRWFVRDMHYAAANGDLVGERNANKIITPTCSLSNTTAVALTSGVAKVLQPANVDWDNNQFWNATTNPTRITFRSPGLYRVSAIINFNAVTGSFRDATIRLNGTTLLVTDRRWPSTANSLNCLPEYLWYFHAGDYIELQAQANTTGVTASILKVQVIAMTPENVIDETP